MGCTQGFVSVSRLPTGVTDGLNISYTNAMQNDETNSARQRLLTRLLEMSREEGSSEVLAWCETQQEQILRNVRMLDVDQIEWLVELAIPRGGEFLTDV